MVFLFVNKTNDEKGAEDLSGDHISSTSYFQTPPFFPFFLPPFSSLSLSLSHPKQPRRNSLWWVGPSSTFEVYDREGSLSLVGATPEVESTEGSIRSRNRDSEWDRRRGTPTGTSTMGSLVVVVSHVLRLVHSWKFVRIGVRGTVTKRTTFSLVPSHHRGHKPRIFKRTRQT